MTALRCFSDIFFFMHKINIGSDSTKKLALMGFVWGEGHVTWSLSGHLSSPGWHQTLSQLCPQTRNEPLNPTWGVERQEKTQTTWVPVTPKDIYKPAKNFFPLNPLTAEWIRALIYFTLSNARRFYSSIERFSIAFTASGKRQAEISSLPKTRVIYSVSVYILPVSHSYGASTKNREISENKIFFLLLRQAAACRLPFGVGRKREAKSL